MPWKKSFAFEKNGPKCLEISRPWVAPIWKNTKYTISVNETPIDTVVARTKWKREYQLSDNTALDIQVSVPAFFIRRNGQIIPGSFNPKINHNVALVVIFIIGGINLILGIMTWYILALVYGLLLITLGVCAKRYPSPLIMILIMTLYFAYVVVGLFMNIRLFSPSTVIIFVFSWLFFFTLTISILSRGYTAASFLRSNQSLNESATPIRAVATLPLEGVVPVTTIENQLRQLQTLQVQGLITEIEYEEKKKELLQRI